jgi:hypothetical protein
VRNDEEAHVRRRHGAAEPLGKCELARGCARNLADEAQIHNID